MRQHWLVGGVVVLLLLGLLGLASQLIRVEQTVDQGFQGEAARNPLFLAERLLLALGREADGVRVVPASTLLQPTDTLVMNTPSYTLTRQQMNELLDWVGRGGHLITASYESYDLQADWGADLLLDTLEIQVTQGAEGDPSAAAQRSQEVLGRAVRFDGFLRLQPATDEVLFSITDEQGAFLLQYGWDEGLITVLVDLSMFTNERLVEADHAEFLWELAGRTAASGKVWLQYTRQVPSLLELLLRHAWMPLLGLSLALLGWLWQRGQRFGPLVEVGVVARRSLLDHVQASGRFLWRHNLSVVLLAAVRRRSQQRLMRRIPGWRQLGDEARASHAARLSRLPVDEVRKALRADRTDDFFSTVKILSKLASL